MAKKVASGADFVQTQIIYNVEKFARFMEMVRDLGLDEKVYILAGVTPPKSLGMARYMKSSVPGMDVTDEVISRMKDAADKQEEGINICVDIINRVREIKGVSGVHIMAIEWEEAVPEIVKRAKLEPRPVLAEDVRQPAVQAAEVIEIAAPAVPAPQPSVDTDKLLAEARAEAEKIIAAARAEVEKMRAQAVLQATAGSAPEYEDAGEHEMNEKERQLALQSVQMGLNALKKAFNLSDEQFEALSSFASAEAVLKRQPPETATAGPVTAPAAAEAVKPAPDKAAEEAKKAAEPGPRQRQKRPQRQKPPKRPRKLLREKLRTRPKRPLRPGLLKRPRRLPKPRPLKRPKR